MSAFAHQLFLDIPYTSNPKTIRIMDASIYTDKLPINCGTLQITVPGFNAPVSIDVDPEFNVVLNACNLGIQSQDCGSYSATLPDGIYLVRYSVSPNDKVFVEYSHLRVTQILNTYYQNLADLELAACEPGADVKAKLNELRLIKSFIDAAKAKVEYCQDNSDALSILQYAQKRLAKLDCKTCLY
jgi:hypothetical protein